MNIIDRYLLRQFLQNFVICFLSLTGVYVVFDAFTNLEAFMSLAKGAALMKIIAAYYGTQSLFFFDRISALLVLMSAMFTMAWIQRHHEMTALMAAGISRIRVVAPVLAASVAIILLAVINREIVIPKLKDQLAMRPVRPERQHGRGTAAAVRQRHRRADRRTACDCRSRSGSRSPCSSCRPTSRRCASTANSGRRPRRITCRPRTAGPRAICSGTLSSRRTWRKAPRCRWTAGPS